MTLRFHWLHAPRWLGNVHVNRAMTLVLGIICVSLLFCAFQVLDVAISGVLVEFRPAVVAPAASASLSSHDVMLGTEPPASDVRPFAADFEVPEATVDAVSL
ncbi:MAG: hypothetical protein ABIR54_12950 [Burkholderiaceae bacterium]|jgi:hypothetical protein